MGKLITGTVLCKNAQCPAYGRLHSRDVAGAASTGGRFVVGSLLGGYLGNFARHARKVNGAYPAEDNVSLFNAMKAILD